MFDIGGIEFLVVLIVALLVVGPKELPALLRTLGKYAGMLKKQASEFRSQFDDVLKESEFSDIKKDFETMGEDASAEMRDVEKSVSEGLEEFDDHSNLDDDDFEDFENEIEGVDDSPTKSDRSAKQASDTETDTAASDGSATDSMGDSDTEPKTAEAAVDWASTSNGHDHAASTTASKDAGIVGEDLGIERKSGT